MEKIVLTRIWPGGVGKPASFQNGVSINFDAATGFPQVANHIPVQAGIVEAAGFGVGGADSGVAGAADFFIEECVLGVLLDVEIGADGDFAQAAGTGVLIQHGDEEIQTFAGGGIHHFARLKGEGDIVAFAAVMDGGETVANGAFSGVFDGAGENLTIGEIFFTIAIDPAAALNA